MATTIIAATHRQHQENWSTDHDLHDLLQNLNKASHETQTKYLDIILEQVKIVPSSTFLINDSDGMCLLHRILETFLESNKNPILTEIIKNILIRSETNYRDYFYVNKDKKIEQKIILTLLKLFDKKHKSVTYYLRQILHSEEAKFINLIQTSHQNIAPNLAIGVETNFQHILEITFIAGSLDTLKVLLEYGHQYHDFNKLKTPILITVVEVFEYVQAEKREKYYACLDYLLREEQLDVNAKRDGLTVFDVVKDSRTKTRILQYL